MKRVSLLGLSFSILLLVGICLSTAVCAQAQFGGALFFEDFEYYEDERDLVWEWIPAWGKQELVLTTDYNHTSGGNKAVLANKIAPVDGNRVGYKYFDEIYEECIIEIWFYDPLEGQISGVVGPICAETDKMPYVGVFGNLEKTRNHYVVRDWVADESWDTSDECVTGIERTKGWHKVTFRIYDGNTEVYIDGQLVRVLTSIKQVAGVGIGSFWYVEKGYDGIVFDDIALYPLERGI